MSIWLVQLHKNGEMNVISLLRVFCGGCIFHASYAIHIFQSPYINGEYHYLHCQVHWIKKTNLFSIPVMMFHATFNNISVISWRSVLVVGRNRRPSASHWQTLSHNVVLSRHRHERGNLSSDKRVKWVIGKRKFIQGLLLKIGVSFTVYTFLLQKILNYRTFNIHLYIES